MNTTKRLLAILIALTLVLMLFPATASAAAKPAPPKGLKAVAASMTTVQLSWNKVSKAKNYVVYQKSGSKYVKIASPKKNTFTVKKLKPDTKYSFKVAVRTAGGTSKQSKAVSAKTWASASGPTPDPNQDIVPTGVSISLQSGYVFLPVTGGACTLAAAITPSNANKYTAITWSSNNTAVATVDANGNVAAKGAGDATITAATANGAQGAFRVRVGADVTSLSFSVAAHDLKTNTTVPMYLPKILPDNAYSLLTFTSSNTAAAEVYLDSQGDFYIKAKAAGTATITAASHNNKTASFTVTVKPPLTNATIPSSYTMGVCTYWTPAVTLTPASGAYGNYVLSSSNTDILRVEKNKDVYSIKPGSAQLTVSIDGVVKSTCNVTISPPALAGNVALKYYNVKYESSGKASVTLGVVPVSGVGSYIVTEHINYNSSMTPAQLFAASNLNGQWVFTPTQAQQPITITNVNTGLRFFSVAAMSGTGGGGSQIGSTFVGRVPVLYHPRNAGGPPSAASGSNPAADGFIMPLQLPFYMPSVGNFMLGGDMWLSSGFGTTFFIPSAPYALRITFDKIPNAVGYDVYATCNGKLLGNSTLNQPGTNRCSFDTDFIFENGDTIINILPYVKDTDGTTKLYGEMRTIVFKNVDASKFYQMYYWEDSASGVNDPVLLNDFSGL